jgi:hypothetical protein
LSSDEVAYRNPAYRNQISIRPSGYSISDLLLVATLVTRLTQQLAVLLLRHALATLLDD